MALFVWLVVKRHLKLKFLQAISLECGVLRRTFRNGPCHIYYIYSTFTTFILHLLGLGGGVIELLCRDMLKLPEASKMDVLE